METTELQVVSFTLGRKTRVQWLKSRCGVYSTACYLRNRGYSLQQSLTLLNRGIA